MVPHANASEFYPLEFQKRGSKFLFGLLEGFSGSDETGLEFDVFGVLGGEFGGEMIFVGFEVVDGGFRLEEVLFEEGDLVLFGGEELGGGVELEEEAVGLGGEFLGGESTFEEGLFVFGGDDVDLLF